jgi:hypothetical protein
MRIPTAPVFVAQDHRLEMRPRFAACLLGGRPEPGVLSRDNAADACKPRTDRILRKAGARERPGGDRGKLVARGREVERT